MIDCEYLWKALFKGIVVLENKFPNISLGGERKNSKVLIWVCHISILASLSIVK